MIRLEEKAGPAATRSVDEWIEIDLPEMDVQEWNSTTPVAPGRPVVLSILPAAGEPGRVHVLAALVTLHEVERPQ